MADVAALLNQFGDDDTEGVALLPEAEATAAMAEPEPFTRLAILEPEPLVTEEKFEPEPRSPSRPTKSLEAAPTATTQSVPLKTEDAPQTTRSSSFAIASSTRNALPALAPLNEGSAQQVNDLSGDDSANAVATGALTLQLGCGSPTAD